MTILLSDPRTPGGVAEPPRAATGPAAQPAPRRRRHVTGLLLIVALVSTFAVVLPAAPAAAACSSRTFSVFPGSASSNLRYGQVSYRFEACTTTPPSSWSGSVVTIITNNTGKRLGFSISAASITTTSTTGSIRSYLGSITGKSCALPLNWPCKDIPFTVRFTVSYNSRTGSIDYHMGTRTAPIQWVLYTTP